MFYLRIKNATTHIPLTNIIIILFIVNNHKYKQNIGVSRLFLSYYFFFFTFYVCLE